MRTHRAAWEPASGALVAALTFSAAAYADPTPDPSDHPDSTWAIRALAGWSKTGGTTDTDSANALFHVAHVMGDWKVLFGFDGLYGSTRGETTAQAWHARLQGNYNFTSKLYWYASYRYDDDRFSGFAYQQTVATGAGYQFISNDTTKLSAQIGVGERWLRPETFMLNPVGAIIPGSVEEFPTETDTVLDASLNFEHSFNSYTRLLAAAAIEDGRLNTMTSLNVSLQVKMTNLLSLAAGYQLVRNSNPPANIPTNSSLTTLNLVYEFKNSKLPPE
jgi:putative salt-induced outer membrane protein